MKSPLPLVLCSPQGQSIPGTHHYSYRGSLHATHKPLKLAGELKRDSRGEGAETLLIYRSFVFPFAQSFTVEPPRIHRVRGMIFLPNFLSTPLRPTLKRRSIPEAPISPSQDSATVEEALALSHACRKARGIVGENISSLFFVNTSNYCRKTNISVKISSQSPLQFNFDGKKKTIFSRLDLASHRSFRRSVLMLQNLHPFFVIYNYLVSVDGIKMIFSEVY